MRLCYLVAALLFCAVLTHAQILNVTAEDIEVPAYSNTNSYVKLLNLSLNLTGIDSVSIVSINVTFNSTASINANATNLTVCAFNETFDAISCNSTWSGNTTVLNMNYEVTNATEKTLYIGYYINRSLVNLSVIHGLNVSLYISSNESITLNDTSVLKDNSTFPLSSRFTQIQDLHAVASISPHYVDTNVKNQSFVYVVNATGLDGIDYLNLTVPGEFTNIQLKYCEFTGGGEHHTYSNCTGVADVSGSMIIINPTGFDFTYLKLNFTADTNQSGEFTRTFNASVSGGNLTDIPVSESSSGALNVTTKQLINNVTITSVKNTAYITSDGSDYWEFNFTVNITANVSGLLQFKMNNWYSPSKNATINLTNGTAYYAKLWKSDEPSNTINVTTEYDASKGISLSNFSGLLRLTLRMYIPPTVQAVTNDWYTLYWMLFRTLP